MTGSRPVQPQIDGIVSPPSFSAASFPDIFQRTAPFVSSALGRLGVREADLPDVRQEVFVVVHRRLPTFDGRKAALRTWIYGICLRVASQYRRRLVLRRETSEAEAREESLMAEQEDALERKRARALLDRVLGELSEDDRAVFVLYELQELSMKEIAASFGWPLQSAYSRLHRARRQVENAFRALAR